MLILELLVASAVFVAAISLICLILFEDQHDITEISSRELAMYLANEYLGSDISSASTTDIDNFTKKAVVTISSFTLSEDIVDTSESLGQSSCRPDQDVSQWKNPSHSVLDLSSFIRAGISITGIDIVGTSLYLSANSASSTDPDFFAFDVSNPAYPRLLSSLDTGPGALAIKVAGNHAYLGNSSINAQLQIIDISDKSHPYIVSSFKLPGKYNDETTVGSALFYKAGKIFLGTQKSQIAELHVIDASNPLLPKETSSYEIGNAVNDIFAFKDKVYVASPNNSELEIFSLSSSGVISPYSSFDAPGGSGNGKRLSLFLDTVFLGRTVGKDELFALTATSSPTQKKFSFPLGSSVAGILAYGNLLFVADTNLADGFLIYQTASSSAARQNSLPIAFSSKPVAFDCDQDTFYIITESGLFIYVIKPSL